MTDIRPFREEDRADVEAFGAEALNHWAAAGALHLVIGMPAVAHLQAVDRRETSWGRRPGRVEMRLTVAPAHRRRGLGSALYERTLIFARERGAHSLRTSYFEHTPDEPAASFLKHRGFQELERFCPSRLGLTAWDPAAFAQYEQRALVQGVCFVRYADLPNTPEHRRQVYDLEMDAKRDIPLQGQEEGSTPETFEHWDAGLRPSELPALWLAVVGDEWVGMTRAQDWGFTGVRRAWRGRGIATALKVRALRDAKERGVPALETENHADNAPMLAVNRRLGYRFGTVEVACIKRLG